MKRFTSIFLVLAMMLTFAPVNIASAKNESVTQSEQTLNLKDSDAFMESLFGSDMSSGTETDEGYVYEMTPEILDEFIAPINNAAAKDGISLGAEENFSGNELPEGYVDDSNEELLKIQKELENSAGISLMSAESAQTKVDIVFVIDSTGSMSSAIRGVKTNVAAFAQHLAGKGLTLRLGLIDYRDITCDGSDSTVIHKVNSSPWMNIDGFLSELSKVSVDGGGDYPETPIDALGYLTNGSAINWSSDAYKFAILITDASYKNDNTHSISDMTAMTDLLAAKDIQTSVITSSSCLSIYGRLAMMTGGFTANIDNNFSSLLADYADSVIGTTLPVKEYSVQVLDGVINKPVSGASVSWEGGSTTTDSSGIAKITVNENPIYNVSVNHPSYGSKRMDSLFLNDGETTSIYISSNKIGKDPITNDDTPVFNRASLPVLKSGSGDLSAPQINLLGKKFGLINAKIGFHVPFFDKVEIGHDLNEKKFEVIFGRSIGEEKEDDPYWKSDYKKYKSLVRAFDKNTSAKDIYNNFRSLRKDAKQSEPQKGKMLFPFDMMIGGYGELSYAADADKYFEGGVIVSASTPDIKLINDWPLPPAPYIFLNLKFKVDVTGKVGFIIVAKNPVRLDTPSANIEIAPSLDLSLALGAPKIASIGGGGVLNVKGSADIPFKSMKESLEAKIKGSLYVYVKLLGYEQKESFPFKDYIEIWPDTGIHTETFSLSRNIGLSDFKPIQRNSNADNGIMLMSMNNEDFIYFDKNSYENSSPELIRLSDDKYVLFWIGDDTSRKYSSDMAALMYSVYENKTWSAPKILDDDGTADYNPTVKLNDDGTVCVVWQDNAKAFNTNDMSLQENLKNIDISYAKLNVNTGEILENTVVSAKGDGIYKMMPLVSSNDSETTITWIENNENDPLMLNGTNAVKSVTKQKNAQEWTAPKTEKENIPTITSMDNAYVNGENVIAYVEGNYSKEYGQILNSNKISVLKASGNTEITAVQEDELSDDEISRGASKIQFVGGKLYWNDIIGVRSADISKPDNIVTVNKYGNKDFEILENTNGRKVVISIVGEGMTNNIYASYEANDGSWNQPVKITDYDKNIRDISGFYGNDGKIYLAFNQTAVSENGGDISLGGTDLVVAALSPEEDIIVNPDGAVEKSKVVPGKNVDITLTLSNTGAQESKPLKATIYNNGNKVGEVSSFYAYKDTSDGYEKYSLNTINGGETLEVDVPYTVPEDLASPQNLEIAISAQDGSPIGSANKKASVSINPSADLSVSNVRLSSEDERTKIVSVVKNEGYADARDISVSLYDENGFSNGIKLNGQQIPLLKAGDEQAVEFEIDASLLAAESEFDYKRFIVEAAFDGEEWILDNNTSDFLAEPKKTGRVTLSDDEIVMTVGETKAIGYDIENKNAANKTLNWLSSDVRVAKVNNDGVVEAFKKGEVTITAVPYDGGEADSLKLTVMSDAVSVNGVEIKDKPSEMKVGDELVLSAVVKPDNATNKKVKWYTTDSNVISIEANDDSCTLIAVSDGTAQINVVTDDGAYSDTVSIVVTGTAIPVTDIKIDSGDSRIYVGDSKTFKASVAPDNATVKKVKWSIEDESIASINVTDGICTVTGLSAGTTKLYAKSLDETCMAGINITVSKSKQSSGSGVVVRHAVTFDTNGGSAVSKHTVTHNTAVTKPADPQKDGYVFAGWFADKELNNEYDFSAKVTKDITLYAKWDSIDAAKNQIIFTIGKKEAAVFGETKINDVAPVIRNDRSFLPARFVAENLGANVEWDDAERKVIITKDDIKIVITIDSDAATVNNETVMLDYPAFIENDRTYTPIRFVAEKLGCSVDWDGDNQLVIIEKAAHENK